MCKSKILPQNKTLPNHRANSRSDLGYFGILGSQCQLMKALFLSTKEENAEQLSFLTSCQKLCI
jgi:hypothetical protein